MVHTTDPFIQKLHSMCKKDDIVMNQLIAGTMSWADVPSDDDDILELEGWRAYAEVHHRAKSAYHRTVRSQKRSLQRTTVKQVQPKPMGRKPYHIMRQEQIKHVLSNGRMTPVKEIVDVVVQEPVEYEEVDITFIATEKPVEVQMETPCEVQMETPVEVAPSVEPPVEPSVELTTLIIKVPSQITKRHSKEKLNKKKQVPTPIIYQPSFTQLYIIPCIPYLGVLFILFIIMTAHL